MANSTKKPIDFFAEHPKAVAVEGQPDYMLALEFDNGERGLLDVKPYLDFGVFHQLRDPAVFRTARVISFGAIAWIDGSIDLHPAIVYGRCKMESETVKK